MAMLVVIPPYVRKGPAKCTFLIPWAADVVVPGIARTSVGIALTKFSQTIQAMAAQCLTSHNVASISSERCTWHDLYSITCQPFEARQPFICKSSWYNWRHFEVMRQMCLLIGIWCDVHVVRRKVSIVPFLPWKHHTSVDVIVLLSHHVYDSPCNIHMVVLFFALLRLYHYTPIAPKMERIYWIHLVVCPSVLVHLSICRQESFEKIICPIYFMPGIYSQAVSLLTPIHFHVHTVNSALWWPNICLKFGFPGFYKKVISSNRFIFGIYPYGASHLTSIHFYISSINFHRNLCWIMAASLISLLLLWWPPAESHYNIYNHSAVGYVTHPHCIILLYSVWYKITTIFLDKVGSDQRGYIIPFYGRRSFLPDSCDSSAHTLQGDIIGTEGNHMIAPVPMMLDL